MAYSATHSASPNSMADCPQLNKPMPPFPGKNDATATWNYLQAGLDRIMTDGKEGIDTKTYMGLYNAIHNFCTAQKAVESGGFGANNGGASNRGGAHLLGEDLYNHLIEYLKEHVRDVYEKSTEHADEALLTFYIKEWNRYSTAAKDIDCLFGYLNRHWVKREMDEGKKNIYDIYTLHLVPWKDDMFMQTQENIVKPVLRLVEKQRDGETIEQNQIKSVVDSFVSLGVDESDSTKTTLDVYKEFFEKPFLEATADYYRKESSRFLAENSVVDYMKYAEARLEEEKERVPLYLLDEIMGPLMRTCDTVLIADHAQTLREEFQLLLDQDRIDDLSRMYMLLARIPNGLDPLRTRFEKYVCKTGLSAVEKVATPGTSFTYTRHFSKPSDFHTTVSAMNAQNIILTTSEGVNIEVERQVAERSILIKNLLGYFGAEPGEPLPVNVKERVMRKVIEWCEYHKMDPPVSSNDDSDPYKKSTDIDEWDQEFMQVDEEMLFDIILAANYLDIKALLDVGCKTVANMAKGKSCYEICKKFNIQNDFTPEEEDQIRRENDWAEDRIAHYSRVA